MVILISDKVDIRTEDTARDKENTCIMINWPVHLENLIIPNTYSTMEQKVIELQGKIKNS